MRCIECEEIELARVSDQRPVQTLPVPHAALDGFPAGRRPGDLTRRRLLQFGVAGMASVYGPRALGWESVWESVAAEAALDQNCLVLLYLAGGNDGLNTIVPNGDADWTAYAAARGAIHRLRGPSTADRIGSTRLTGDAGDVFAFANVVASGGNNDTRGLDTLYADDALAIMPAVDALQYSLSHFDNSDIWFKASYSLNEKTGWLGRWIDEYGQTDNPLQAISIDAALSKSIRTARKPVCAIPSLSSLGFNMSVQGGVSNTNVNAQMQALAGLQAGRDNAYLERTRGTYGLAVETHRRSLDAGPFNQGAGYPNGTLGNRLKLAAHLLGANLGTRIITIHWGGFDTHSGQLASQDIQLIELSRALAAFRADLQARAIENRVCTLVFSEFGRRVAENGSAGTDHGAGGLMMAMGSKVRGGLASVWPGCRPTDLVPDNNPAQGNLKVPTDYRSVYRAVIEEWLERRSRRSSSAAARSPTWSAGTAPPVASCSNDRPARRRRGDGDAARQRSGRARQARQGRRLRRAPPQDQARVPAPRRPSLPPARALAPRPRPGAGAPAGPGADADAHPDPDARSGNTAVAHRRRPHRVRGQAVLPHAEGRRRRVQRAQPRRGRARLLGPRRRRHRAGQRGRAAR